MTGQDGMQREIECLVNNVVKSGEITQDQANKVLQRAEDDDWLSELWQEIDEKIDERIQETVDEIKDEEAEEEAEREKEETKPEKVIFT